MKKRIMMILMTAIVVIMAGCGKTDAGNSATKVVDVESSAALLNQVWDTYKEEEKFPAMGGDAANPVDGKAGSISLDDAESLDVMFHLPVELIGSMDEGASLIHAMNANTFTGAAYHLKEDADRETFMSSLKDSILNTHWLCGFPEKLAIYTVDDYVVAAFGNGEIMENFKTKVADVYGDAAVLVVDTTIE